MSHLFDPAPIFSSGSQVLPPCSPCIWTRNSVLILRAASLSFSLLEPHRESISSMKMIDGLCSRANVNRLFTNLERDGRRGKQWLLGYLTSGFCICLDMKQLSLTFHFLRATLRRGRRRRWRRRWSCWPLWRQPWPGRICRFLGAQTEGCLSTEFASLHTQMVDYELLMTSHRLLMSMSSKAAAPAFNTCEQMREFDGQDDCFLQGFFGSLQSSHIVPLNVGLFHDDGTCKKNVLG